MNRNVNNVNVFNSLDGISNSYEFHYCEDNNYHPFLNRYINEKQRIIYDQFYEFVEADFMLIEINSSVIDMVICYKKDKELSVPVLELEIGRDICG